MVTVLIGALVEEQGSVDDVNLPEVRFVLDVSIAGSRLHAAEQQVDRKLIERRDARPSVDDRALRFESGLSVVVGGAESLPVRRVVFQLREESLRQDVVGMGGRAPTEATITLKPVADGIEF